MDTHIALCRDSAAASRRQRRVLVLAFAWLTAAFTAASLPAQSSVVPVLISYQGRVTAANGTLAGDPTPVNRLVTFRIWNHASDGLPANLVYAESQTATIAGGEFSVMIGQGTALSTEASKGPPTLKLSDAGVFGGAVRYLGVTVDDGTGVYNVEISPRQQIVTSAYAFRAKYAEQIGANGATTITSLDNGNVGIGNASPSVKLDVGGAIRASGNTTGGGYMFNSGDTDGGIFSPADGTMTFWTNASEKLRIAAGGNLGIGTITPLTKLDVNGNISATAAGGYVFGAGDTDTGMFSAGDNLLTFKTGNVERMRINNSGLVGIGTTGPGFPLEVRHATPEMVVGTSTGTLGAYFLGNNGHGLKRNFANVANDVGLYTTAGSVHLSAAGASAGQFVLTSGGDVGIGTTSPGARFQVTGTNAAGTTSFQVWPSHLNGTNTANAVTLDIPGTPSGKVSVWDDFLVSGNVGIGNTAPTAKLDVTGGVKVTGGGGYGFNSGDTDGGIYSTADGTIVFHADAAERMRIQGAWIGIGTSTPQVHLDVNGSIMAASSGGFVFRNDGDSGMFTTGNDANTLTLRTANVERLRVAANGWVGIGTTTAGVGNPIAPLHVAITTSIQNNPTARLDIAGANGGDFSINGNYSIHATGRIRIDDAVDILSDRRIKEILGKSDGRADLDKLLAIEITDYKFKDRLVDSGRPHKKVIAQQVETLLPSAVSHSRGIVPDIFQKSSIDADGWVALATDLKVGERVRVDTDAQQEVHEVLAVEAHRFRTALKTPTDRAFVYGREVSDLRVVDYDAIAMLNVSATQEIKREKDAEIKALRAEIAELRSLVLALHAQDSPNGAPSSVVARPAAPKSANGQE